MGSGKIFSLAAVLLGLLFLQLALSLRHQSQTIDEGFHLIAGYRYWQCGDFGINSEHPPLMKFVAAVPLWFGHAPAPEGTCGQESTDKGYGYGLGVDYLYDGKVDADKLLFRSRLTVSVFALLLATGCFLFARSLFDNTAALIALLLLVFEPNVLAHGALITTDAALSAFMLLTVFAFRQYHRSRRLSWLFATGILAGLTLASKHSGVLVIPILVLLAAVDYAAARNEKPRTLYRALWTCGEVAAIVIVGVCLLWCVYGFRFAARPGAKPMDSALSEFVADVQEEGTHGAVLTQVIPRLSRWHLLPEAYLHGLVDVLNVSDPGQPPYLLGKLYPHGRWFYFPVTFFIKSTLAFLILLGIAVAFAARRWRDRERLIQLAYLAIPPLVVLAVAMQSGLDIGYRHVLAILAFLCVFIAGAVTPVILDSRGWRALVIGLLLAHVASSLHAYPNYIPYSNELWGGPSQTYRNLTDSNVDWGQALYQTRDYLSQNGIHDCWMAYDGTIRTSYYGIPCRKLTANASNPADVPPERASGTFIISALTVSGIEWEPGELNPYLAFQRTTPMYVIGGAMLVYRGTFDLTGVVAATHIANSNDLHDARKPTKALDEAEAAVALTPKSVRAHLALGRALSALGRKTDARDELHNTLDLAHQIGDVWYPVQIADARRELDKLRNDDIGNRP